VCEVAASLSLKGALDRPILYVAVASGYLLAFVLLDAVLKAGLGLGVAYGVWGALGVTGTAVMSHVIYDEPLGGLMVLGILLVVAGVVLVELGSQVATRKARSA
jgi:small multidrug resistance pump